MMKNEYIESDDAYDDVKLTLLELLEKDGEFRRAFRNVLTKKPPSSDISLITKTNEKGVKKTTVNIKQQPATPTLPSTPSGRSVSARSSIVRSQRRNSRRDLSLAMAPSAPAPTPKSTKSYSPTTSPKPIKRRTRKRVEKKIHSNRNTDRSESSSLDVKPPLPDDSVLPATLSDNSDDHEDDEDSSDDDSELNLTSNSKAPPPPLPSDDNIPATLAPPLLPPAAPGNGVLLASSELQRVCGGCTKSIGVDEKHFEVGADADRTFWHVDCFRCADCATSLANAEFKTHQTQVYCDTHFAERFCPRCGGCDEPITTEVFSVALGKSWHPGHFACVNCKTGLKTDFVSDEEQRPFCDADCFAEFEEKEQQQ